MSHDEIDYDNPAAEIERLHAEAEDLVDLAKYAKDPFYATCLRQDAKRKIRQAARLRAQIDEA